MLVTMIDEASRKMALVSAKGGPRGCREVAPFQPPA